ncbi:MAG: hypothetical protein ACREOY_03585 [Candidatus Dormibacteraceae bacterium]
MVGRGNLGRTLARAAKAAGHPGELRRASKGIPSLVRSLRSSPDALEFLAVPDVVLANPGQLARVGSVSPDRSLSGPA